MDWLDDSAAFAAAHDRSRVIGRAWRDSPPVRDLTARFDAVMADETSGHSREEIQAAAMDAAEAWLSDAGALGTLLSPLIAALREDSRFEPPFRVHRDPLRIGAVVFDHPLVTITAGVMFADALATLPPARTVVLTGRRSVTRYHRAAGARLARWTLAEGACRRTADMTLSDGLILRLDGRRQGMVVTAAPRDVVTVTATLRPAPGGVMREFAVADGAPVRTATLDDEVSRTSALLTLLRISGRSDAGTAFDAASRHTEHHLRWTAMREWLALDVCGALPRLVEMAADDPHREVRGAAAVTLDLARQRVRAAACHA